MPLVRLLSLCLVVLALAAQPSRAASVCPMAVAPAQHVHADHDHATSHRHQPCSAPMACCAPVAVNPRGPALVSPLVWQRLLRARPVAERDREGAALAGLLRPPRSV